MNITDLFKGESTEIETVGCIANEESLFGHDLSDVPTETLQVLEREIYYASHPDNSPECAARLFEAMQIISHEVNRRLFSRGGDNFSTIGKI
jgi:hypothetical protein